jgi:pyridoxine kinase
LSIDFGITVQKLHILHKKDDAGRNNRGVNAMGKRILLINDMVGYGKVALSAMMPVLSHMQHQVYNLPTALVSNTLDYGRFAMLETTDYMTDAMAAWKELGFAFDAVAAGFIVSEKQARLVMRFCEEQRAAGALIFADPIMGDHGRLYNGVAETTIAYMRELVQVSDFIVPNYTEAAYLAGEAYQADGMREAEVDHLLERLLSVGAKSVVITSARVDNRDAVIVYDHKKNQRDILHFSGIPVRVPGAGDLFHAIFIANILSGSSPAESAGRAMNLIGELIRLNRDRIESCKGIPVENFFSMLDQ